MSSSSPAPLLGQGIHTHAERLRGGITTAQIDTHSDDVSGLLILEELPFLRLFQTDGALAYANIAFCSFLGRSKPETLKISSAHFNGPAAADPQKYVFSAFIAKPYNIQVLSAVLGKTIEGIPS